MKIDVLFNYAERAIHIALRFFMIPIYLSSFGISAYGLIGVYTTISSMMVLLDFGMGYGAMRILAENYKENVEEVVGVLVSVEVIYLLISILIGVSIAILSQWIAHSWLTINDPTVDGTKAIVLMAILLAVSWPQSLYQSFLSGQKRFVAMNIALIVSNILNTLGMIYFIYYLKEGIEFFFWVMIASMLAQTIALRFLAWRKLPKSRKFAQPKELKTFLFYASGVSLFSIASLVIFQTPALYLSAFAETSDLGLYAVALTFPMAMLTFLYPVTSAAFPRLVTIGKAQEAAGSFRMATQIHSVISICICFMLATNMVGIYSLWLQDIPELEGIVEVSRILLAGVFMYSFQMIFATVFLANAQTKLLLIGYIFAIVVMMASISVMGPLDVAGVAYVWLIMSTSLTLALMCIFRFSHKHLFFLWANIVAKNLLLLSIGLAVFVTLTPMAVIDGFVRQFILSGAIISLVAFYPVKKIFGTSC